jgi:proline iminopeptidase
LSVGPGLASHQEGDVAMALSKKYKAILFDQRGTGKSWTKPMYTTTINLEFAVNDIESLRVHLKISRLIIYGHSWGAMLATAYTAHYQNKVKKFILVGGGELSPKLTDAVNRNIDLRIQLGDTTACYHWTDSTVIAQDPVRAKHELRKMTVSLMIYDQQKLDSIMVQMEHGAMNKEVNRLMWLSITANKENWPEQTRKKYKGETLIIFGWQDPIGLTTLSNYQYAYPAGKTVGIN